MAEQSVPKGGTGKFDRQGHTAGAFGNEPNKEAGGVVAEKPRPLKP